MTEQKTVAFHTLGCKVNQYDTQAMRERFEQAGYRTAEFDGQADIYVVNTCTVTGTGDKKSMQIIRRCHRQNPQAQIVVTGCLAQRAADELTLPGVRLVLGTQRRGEVVELLEQAMKQDCALVAVETLRKAPFEHLTVHAHEGHTRATMKIQEGCDRWCTYCIIPSVRGPIRSRPVDEIAAEARESRGGGLPGGRADGHPPDQLRPRREGRHDAARCDSRGARRAGNRAGAAGLAGAGCRHAGVRRGDQGHAEGLPSVPPRAAKRQRHGARAHASALHQRRVFGRLRHAARSV